MSSPDVYAGNWVMKLGQRNFMVLKLKVENGHLIGTLSRPKHFQTSNGMRFSEISSEIVTGTVATTSLDQGHLHFVVQDLVDRKDEDDYDMALTAENQASLKPAGFPFDPWIISKVQGRRAVRPATDWDVNRLYELGGDSAIPNPEMDKIFAADQKARQSAATMTKNDWDAIDAQEAERRAATRKLLAAGQLHTAKDFAQAAFIFQHGGAPDDYLLAHTLAIIAVAKGNADATWIAAATMDRYLQSIGKPQVYGTQFRFKTESGEPATQEPYNRELIPDSLRRQLGVPSISNQEEELKSYNAPPAKSNDR